MTTRTIYIYERINSKGKKKTTDSLVQNSALGTFVGTKYRLDADPGKVLTDGITITSCIDTNEPERWTEIDEPTPEPEPEVEAND